MFGSALYLAGAVYVATEAGSVYALDGATVAVRWRNALAAVQVLGDGCGTWGITSTPTIDATRGVLYAVGGDGVLHGLDLTTGAEAPTFALQLIARPKVECVWGGLRIVGETLYAPVASYCDELGGPDGPADGRIIAVDLATHATSALDTVPGPDT